MRRFWRKRVISEKNSNMGIKSSRECLKNMKAVREGELKIMKVKGLAKLVFYRAKFYQGENCLRYSFNFSNIPFLSFF